MLLCKCEQFVKNIILCGWTSSNSILRCVVRLVGRSDMLHNGIVRS